MGLTHNAFDQLDAAQLALDAHPRLRDGRCGGCGEFIVRRMPPPRSWCSLGMAGCPGVVLLRAGPAHCPNRNRPSGPSPLPRALHPGTPPGSHAPNQVTAGRVVRPGPGSGPVQG